MLADGAVERMEPHPPGTPSPPATTGPEAAWPDAAWPVRVGAMPPLAEGFTARPETVPALEAELVPGAAVALVPGQGAGLQDWLGSCGKTQLAVHAARTLWLAESVDLMIWIGATSRASVLSGYVQAAAALAPLTPDGVLRGAHEASAESVAVALLDWLAGTARPWLIVLDDLRVTADIEDLWPGGPAGRLLITASHPAAVPVERGVVPLPVPVFSDREAMNYLTDRLIADPDQRNGAIDLAYDLCNEPIALAHASSVITGLGLSCPDYREQYARWQLRFTPSGGPAAVTWALSADCAERQSPGASAILALAAFLDGRAMPGTVFSTRAAGKLVTGGGVDPDRAWRGVLGLEQAGLLVIDRTTVPATARMPRPVQAAARAAMSPEVAARAMRAAADALLEAWPRDEPRSPVAADLRSCVAALRQLAGDALWSEGRCHPVLLKAGRSLDDARLAGPAVSHWREIFAGSERLLESGHPDTASAAGRLADALMLAGQAGEAAAWYEWVLTGRQDMFGPDHPGTIEAKVKLGCALVAAGRPADAAGVLASALSDSERVHGPGHLDTLSIIDQCAVACAAAGEFTEAIRLCRRSLADRERVQGPRDPATLAASLRLADTYLAGGQVKEAVAHARRILAGTEQALGPDHAETVTARGRLAAIRDAAGQDRPRGRWARLRRSGGG